METPSRHSFDLDGATRVFPIPSPIKGDNYCRLEVDGVIINDRSKYDIVNNSIVFIDVADVPNGSQLDVLVVQSEEAIGQLTITTNIDIVAQNITDVNTVADDITNVNTTAGSIANVNTVATNIADVNRVEDSITNIDRVHTSIGNIDRVHTSIDKLDRVHTSVDNLDRVHTSIANVDRVNTSIANVDTVANDLNEPVSEIETVAGSITNVDTVGTNIADVNTVAGDISNVNAVAGNQTNIDAVAGNATNINAVNANKTNIDSVAGNASNINAAVSNAANINAVVANASNINSAVANQADIDTVAASIANVNTTAANIANVNLAATNILDIQTIATEVAKVVTVANDLNEATSEIDVVAASIANVDAVGTNISNVNTVASNLTNVNAFHDTYSIAATAPTGATEGDLWFDTTGDKMMVYNGGSWQNAGSSVNGTAARFKFTATASQTAFTGADANGATLAYDAGYIDVYLNGVHLDPSDYTATDGSTITLAAGAAAGDELYVVAFGTFTLATHYTSAQVDSLLAGISSDALIDSGGTTRVQATTSGATVTGVATVDRVINSASTSADPWLKGIDASSTETSFIKRDGSAYLAGNVGIGTSSPSQKLSVEGNVVIGQSSNLYFNNSSGFSPRITNSNSSDTLSIFTNNGTRLEVDGSGRVTMPYQPYFMASTGNNENLTSTGVIPFDTAIHNVGNNFNTSTYTFTAPVAGVYQFNLQAFKLNTDTDAETAIRHNGTIVAIARDSATAKYANLGISIALKLSANDTVDTYVNNPAVHINGTLMHFTGILIG